MERCRALGLGSFPPPPPLRQAVVLTSLSRSFQDIQVDNCAICRNHVRLALFLTRDQEEEVVGRIEWRVVLTFPFLWIAGFTDHGPLYVSVLIAPPFPARES